MRVFNYPHVIFLLFVDVPTHLTYLCSENFSFKSFFT